MKRSALLFALLAVAAILLQGCDQAAGGSVTGTPKASASDMAATTPAKTTAKTTKPKATPTPTAKPTPEPTPTPDPWADFFSPTELVEVVDGKSWTYKGPELAVFIKKVYYEDCKSVFFIAHIYSRNPSNIGCAMEDTKRGRIAVYPQALARKFKAVYAQNGNYFADPVNKDRGPDVRNGIVYKTKIGKDFLCFQPDGEMQVWDTKRDPVALDDLLNDSITQIYGFGPILVEQGKVRNDLKKHVLYPVNPRNAIGQVEPGHYVGILVDGRKPGVSKGVNLQRLAEEFVTQGCDSAYNLDGGQSTAMVFMGNQLNDHKNESAFSGQRRIPDMLTFGTSEQVPAK